MTVDGLAAAAGVMAHVVVSCSVGLRVIWIRRPAGSAFAWLLRTPLSKPEAPIKSQTKPPEAVT